MSETKENTMEAEIVKDVSITELVVAGKVNALKLYNEGGLDTVIAAIGDEVGKLKPDITTKKGRDEIKSTAYKVAQSKTALDKMGKALTADWKEKAKKVDNNRKSMREELDKIRDDVRKPLTDWENIEKEKERILAEEKEAERLRLQEELERREAEVLRKEKAIKEAEEKAEAEREAQAEIQRQKDLAEKLKQEAIVEAERQRALAEHQRKGAERRHQEEIARVQRKAQKKEQERLAEEARVRGEEQGRIANREHCRSINARAVQDFISGGMTEECAQLAIKLIFKNKINNIAITY